MNKGTGVPCSYLGMCFTREGGLSGRAGSQALRALLSEILQT